MADDIRTSGIIEYLVGPESHPELIRLSYNIGSFLVVNHCLTSDIVQAIWKPLIDNKDPRIVQGVIKMVMEFVTHMQYHSIVDLCMRAIDIPFSSYDTTMLEFVSNILSMTLRHYMDEIRVDHTIVSSILLFFFFFFFFFPFFSFSLFLFYLLYYPEL